MLAGPNSVTKPQTLLCFVVLFYLSPLTATIMTQTPKPDSHHQPPTAKPQSDPGATASGLIVTNTDPIRSFLLSATSGSGPDLSPELRDLASDLSSRTSVSYKFLRAIWSALPVSSRPPLARLFAGSEFVFSSPKPREKVRVLD